MKLTKGKISNAIRKKKQTMKKYKRKNVKKSGVDKTKTFRKRKGTNLLKSTLKNYGMLGGDPWVFAKLKSNDISEEGRKLRKSYDFNRGPNEDWDYIVDVSPNASNTNVTAYARNSDQANKLLQQKGKVTRYNDGLSASGFELELDDFSNVPLDDDPPDERGSLPVRGPGSTLDDSPNPFAAPWTPDVRPAASAAPPASDPSTISAPPAPAPPAPIDPASTSDPAPASVALAPASAALAPPSAALAPAPPALQVRSRRKQTLSSTDALKAENDIIIADANAKALTPETRDLANFLRIPPNAVPSLLQLQNVQIPDLTAESIKTFRGLLDYAMTAQKPALFTQSWTLTDPYRKKGQYQIGDKVPVSSVTEITPNNITDLLVNLCCDSSTIQVGSRKLTYLASYWVKEGNEFKLISPVAGGNMKTTDPSKLFVSFDDGKIFINYELLKKIMSNLLPDLQKLKSKQAKMAYFDKSGNENQAAFASAEKIKAGTIQVVPMANAFMIDSPENYAGYIRYLLENTSNVVINYSPVYYLLEGQAFQKQIGKKPGANNPLLYFSFDGKVMIKDDAIPEELRYKYDDLFLWLVSSVPPIPPIMPRMQVVDGRPMNDQRNVASSTQSKESESSEVSIESDNSDLQQEISDLKKQITQLQKQAINSTASGSGSGSGSGSASGLSLLSEGQQNALEDMQGFEPSNMVAFYKAFAMLISTILKLNDNNAGGNGDLKQAMQILASGLTSDANADLAVGLDNASVKETVVDSKEVSGPSDSTASTPSDSTASSANPKSIDDIQLQAEIGEKLTQLIEAQKKFENLREEYKEISATATATADPQVTEAFDKMNQAGDELEKLSLENYSFFNQVAPEAVKLLKDIEKSTELTSTTKTDIQGLESVLSDAVEKDPESSQEVKEELEDASKKVGLLDTVLSPERVANFKSLLSLGTALFNTGIDIAKEGRKAIFGNSKSSQDTKKTGDELVDDSLKEGNSGIDMLPGTDIGNALMKEGEEVYNQDAEMDQGLAALKDPQNKEKIDGGKRKRKSKTKKAHKKVSKSKRSKKNNSKKNKSK